MNEAVHCTFACTVDALGLELCTNKPIADNSVLLGDHQAYSGMLIWLDTRLWTTQALWFSSYTGGGSP